MFLLVLPKQVSKFTRPVHRSLQLTPIQELPWLQMLAP